MMRSYFESGYEIRSVLRTLFNSDYFKSERSMYKRVKAPVRGGRGRRPDSGKLPGAHPGSAAACQPGVFHGPGAAHAAHRRGVARGRRVDRQRARWWSASTSPLRS